MKELNLKKEYKKCFRYIEESKKFIYSVVVIFFIFGFIGFFISPPKEISNQIFEYIKQLLEQTKDYGAGEMIWFIFLNNLKSSFLGLFGGIFLGIFSLVNAIANGYMLGFVSFYSVMQSGGLSLWRLFPHGIFELPAIFVALGLGLKMGSFIFEEKKMASLRKSILNSIRVFFLVILPLLFIGSIIEGLFIVLG